MKPSNVCLHKSEIPLLLSGDLPPDEAAAAESHIAECESCRSVIESMIADSCWWDDARHSLAASATRSLHQAEVVNDAEPTTTEQILDLLGPTDDPNMLGRIGPYEIIGILGQGGMGAVFKGFDRSLNRFVAIKMLLPHLAASGAARKRFAREGQAVAAVVDDHVMAIHCVDEWQGVPYLVMTYSRGVSLQKRLSDNGPLEVREILRIGMQAAKGLAAAHAQGIVHRDIKPANIFLDQNVERVQLMDFGLARAVDDASLTRSGTLAGTPQYMSPEQARAETVDHRSDLFSLGSVMYAMCTGHAPFRAESSYSVLRLITDKEPRPIREINPEIPEWLCAIISKLMAKQVNDRFASAQEVAKLLEDCLAHVQQPTIAALPDGLVDRSVPGSFSFRSRTIGVFAMFVAVCSIIVAMLLMQTPDKPSPNGEPPSPTNIVNRVDSGQSTHLMKPVTKENSEYRVTLLGITREVSAEFTEREKLPGESQPHAWMRAIAMIERLDNVDGPYGFEAQVTDGLKQTRQLKIRSTSELDLNSRHLASKISPIAVPKFATSARGKIFMFTIYGEFQTSDVATLRFQFGRPGQQELVFEDVKIPSIEKAATTSASARSLVGHWKVAKLADMPASELAGATVVIDKDTVKMHVPSQKGPHPHWRYTLVAEGEIDLCEIDDAKGETTSRAKYSLEGRTLYLAVNAKKGDYPRPESSKSDVPQADVQFIVLATTAAPDGGDERHVDKPQVPAQPSLGKTLQQLQGKWRLMRQIAGDGEESSRPYSIWEFKDDRIIVRDGGPGGAMLIEVDDSQSPVNVKLTIEIDEESGLGLMSIEGDKAIFCLGKAQKKPDPQSRPDKLQWVSGVWYMELTRMKPGETIVPSQPKVKTLPMTESEMTLRNNAATPTPSVVGESQAPAIDHGNARSVVEAYVASALAGAVAKAAALAKNASADPKRIKELPEFLNVQRLNIQTVYINDPAKTTRALATSAAVKLDEDRKQPDGQRDGFMVFTLELTDDKWFVIDIDFESESGAEKELKRFLEANPNSIGLPPLTSSSMPNRPHRADPSENAPRIDVTLARKNAKAVAEAYIAAVNAGDVETAAALSKKTPSDQELIKMIPNFIDVQRLTIAKVYVDDPANPKRALASSERVEFDFERKQPNGQPNGQLDGFMVFKLEMSDTGWFVTHIDFLIDGSFDRQLIEKFLDANPKAINLSTQASRATSESANERR